MRKLIIAILSAVLMALSSSASAILSMELTQGVASAVPIAIVPFARSGESPQDISQVVADDLQNSGRFKVFGKNALKQFPASAADVNADYFRKLGTDNVAVGKVTPLGGDRYEVSFELMDMYQGKGEHNVVLKKSYQVAGRDLRAVAHHISDLIYQSITGVRGVFSTRIAYVVIQKSGGQKRYVLEVSDQDGYNPRPMLNSPEPVMTPSWSPDGRKVAYVSFENRRAGIYMQNVQTGARQLISEFPGINGAPAWSPDGRKIALVLSKSGSPNIYVLDVNSRQLTQLTNDSYINTEPAWSPDMRSLLFTSNRSGGGPQVYQINLASKAVTRVTYDGNYNARPAFTPDGNHIAVIHMVSGIYKIGMLDLDSGTMRVLTSSAADTASPSVAPNGSMVLYDTRYGNRNMLGMVSTDGRVQLVLPARNGDAQDPAWSPFEA